MHSYCLDGRTGNMNLYMGGCHSGTNQQFWWNTGVKLEIKKEVWVIGVTDDSTGTSTN